MITMYDDYGNEYEAVYDVLAGDCPTLSEVKSRGRIVPLKKLRRDVLMRLDSRAWEDYHERGKYEDR